jgi:tryptophan-rich sensory protein
MSSNMNSVLQDPEPRRFWIPLAILLGLCFAVAALGGAVTATSVGTWYQGLAKPSFNPPDWIFGPVWTALYAMMALAAALAWRHGVGTERRAALGWFLAQLALNLAWSCIFFGLQLVGLAFVCLTLLWIAVFGTLVHFWAIRRWAGLLLLPYLAWISFAGLLNFLIWRLN